jgi:hypothetical protein
MYFIHHCFICRPSDSTVTEDAGIKPRTLATSALAVRCSSHSAIFHPQVGYILPMLGYQTIGLSDYGYRTVIFFCCRTIGILNIVLANSRNYWISDQASIYWTIRYRTQKKLSVAHLCEQVIERGVAATSTI